MKLEDFTAAWDNEPDLNRMQKVWNLRADEFNDHFRHRESSRRQADVLAYLTEKGMLFKGSSILDIGCGPGRFTVEFAGQAKQAVGLDISPKMLEHARENARQANCDNVFFDMAAWESLDLKERGWVKKFDLVFASMCPGISSGNALLKMCQASSGACFMSSFAKREGAVRDELQHILHNRGGEARWGRNIYYAINILFLSGYYPEITYQDTEWENTWPLEQAVENYTNQFQTDGSDEEAINKKIRDYLAAIAADGKVSEKVSSKIAWICWKV
ncbi:MAG: class I SAM-dependent methyltransferase [Veillonellales bacterium]